MNATKTDFFSTYLAARFLGVSISYHINCVLLLLLAQLHSSSLTNCLVGHNLNLVEGEG